MERNQHSAMSKRSKVILNVHMADKLIKEGFAVIGVRPSSSIRGRAAFIFEYSVEFQRAMRDLAYQA